MLKLLQKPKPKFNKSIFFLEPFISKSIYHSFAALLTFHRRSFGKRGCSTTPTHPFQGIQTSSFCDFIPLSISYAHSFGSYLFSSVVLSALIKLFYLIGVYKLVGQTIKIGIFSYVLRLSKKPLSANLDAQQADRIGSPNFPDRDDTTTMPPLDFLMRGKAAFVRQAFEKKLVLISCQNTANSFNSQNLKWALTPAFRTKKSN